MRSRWPMFIPLLPALVVAGCLLKLSLTLA
jgi:hypothetical protein